LIHLPGQDNVLGLVSYGIITLSGNHVNFF
jgi:hypothetical protein